MNAVQCTVQTNRSVMRLILLIAWIPILLAAPLWANPPEKNDDAHDGRPKNRNDRSTFSKQIDQPDIKERQKIRENKIFRRAIEKRIAQAKPGAAEAFTKELLAMQALAKTGTDKVLVILVEFAGTDKILYTPGVSTWDPIGKCDASEFTGEYGTPAATTNINSKYSLNAPTTFTYTGPMHNQIERPLSQSDRSGDLIWTPDFSKAFYQNLIFGNGVEFKYDRQDGSKVSESFLGYSVNKYYEDLSGGNYHIAGEVVGWLSVPHSVWWYGADPAPGARSGVRTSHNGGIPGAGSARTLVIDALNAVKKANPSFNWKQFDGNGDGVIDRLWIIHAGLGEEDSTILLNRTNYGEGGLWSHSSSLAPYYPVFTDGATTISAGPYIMMPENCGIGVLAHEYGHSLGADDQYAYDGGETSAGFWTIMADDWTGYPIGFLPPSFDPLHLDNWGWLNPLIIANPEKTYDFTIGQASKFPIGTGAWRGAKIILPDGKLPLSVQPIGSYQWWGGDTNLANAMMTLKTPIAIPASGEATLSFSLAYDMEEEWDFLWVQTSSNAGATWTTLANANTTSNHDSAWIGGLYGFPDNLSAAGIGGFTGTNPEWPAYATQTFNLNAFRGKSILLRFWYMTDWGTVWFGPFVDDIFVKSGSTTLFSDNAESSTSKWNYTEPWNRNDGQKAFAHAYYLQWRNVSSTGGYDQSLGDSRWRFGPANTGLLVWYHNSNYPDNEVTYYLRDLPGFGPKGNMLVVDAHPEPYRDPYWVAQGYANEGANLDSRSLMRDAPFSLWKAVDFKMKEGYIYSTSTAFSGYPAVSMFSDALGYYPGAEYVSRGPGYSPPINIWLTRQWDASVVIPSKTRYGVKAPGYTANQEFRYRASRLADGKLSAWYFGTGVGLGYDGGTGNPKDFAGHYGWNIRIISQSSTTASIRVWNNLHTPAREWREYP